MKAEKPHFLQGSLAVRTRHHQVCETQAGAQLTGLQAHRAIEAHRTVGSWGEGSQDCRLTWVKAHRGACFSPWPRHPDRHTALPSNTVFEKTYFRKVTGTFWQKSWTFLEISENTNKFDMDVIRSQWVVIQKRRKLQLSILGLRHSFHHGLSLYWNKVCGFCRTETT